MKPEMFFDNFELLDDAPNGVQKLRELILQLAVRGKLVQQDANDEPAEVLVEKIKSEKERLVKEKKIRKTESIAPIQSEGVRFEIPDKWRLVRFGEITICRDGERIPVSKDERSTRQKIYDYYGASGIIDKIDSYLFDKPLLLIGEDGANLINRSTPIAFIAKGKYWVNNHAHVIDSISFDCLRYLEVFINAIDLAPFVTGTAQPKMNQEKMNSIVVSFPPLAEQFRIVAKVDQLMSLCDELEARQQKKRESRARLNIAALDRLLAARAPGEFAQGWRRISDNFDVLYDMPENVGALRQAILQLAVMGKLVGQDANDEPAYILLEKIKAEKERLIREGRFKKADSLPSFKEIDVPYQLPPSWEWIPLGEVVDYNGAPKVSPSEIPEDAWLLDLEDIEKDTSRIIQRITARDRKSKSTKAEFREGDVLYGKLRPYLNKVVVANSDGFCTTEIVPLRIYYGISPKYLMYALKRPDFLNYVNSKTYGVKMPRLGTDDARRAPFPLAPLEEQRRIVAKLDQLMSLCNKLEAGLLRSQADGERLMEAVVGRMLAGEDSVKEKNLN